MEGRGLMPIDQANLIPQRRVTSIAPWTGSKGRMAQLIVRELGDHDAYYEPCCGGCSVLLAKDVSRVEIINDLSPDLVNLVAVLASAMQPVFAERLSSHVFCEASQRASRLALMTEPFEIEDERQLAFDKVTIAQVDRAVHAFIVWWMGCGGDAGKPPRTIRCSFRSTTTGGTAAQRFLTALSSISWINARLRAAPTSIYCRDAHALIDSIPDQDGAVVYLDPPYIKEGGQYAYDEVDHARLAAQLRRFRRTRVVVSYYEHPSLRQLYQGWTIVDATGRKNSGQGATKGRKASTVSPERLIINGPSLTDPDAEVAPGDLRAQEVAA